MGFDTAKSVRRLISQVRPPRKTRPLSKLVQEEAGIHVSISPALPEAAHHAATFFGQTYSDWYNRERFSAWGSYKREHFVVAVGGGNTLKAQYKAMARELHSSVDWLKHVRFFPLEASTGEPDRECPLDSLRENLIAPLAHAMAAARGRRQLLKSMGLPTDSNDGRIIQHLYDQMVVETDLSEVAAALSQGKKSLARRKARSEAERYQRDIQHKLGASMEFHYIISGIGKKGCLGAFLPYMPELRIREPEALVIHGEGDALRIALNRGVLVNAEQVSLIVSGSLKLRALGRFEMEESADFEQTVMETPLRMLRESRDIAEKVYMFADEQALHFDVTEFTYTENGRSLSAKAETRDGEDKQGPHALLLHGFMGLFSFTNLLIRLPSDWTVSALHRGSYAKTLDNDQIFPHYAHALREAVLDLSARGHHVPVAGHSIAGVIMDHLLLSLLPDYEAPIRPFETLKGDDRELVDALRHAGMVQLATWAPADGVHAGTNIQNLVSNWRHATPLDYSGLEQFYEYDKSEIVTRDDATVTEEDGLQNLNRFLSTPLAEPVINGITVLVRSLLNREPVQRGMLNANTPYVLRLVGNRLLKRASFYGLCKEVNAALHDPEEYQQRHLKALQIIAEYDIPLLSMVHEDDFLVSAQRHQEEHNYLLKLRKKKHGKGVAQDQLPTTRFVLLKRESEELPRDPLNPHLMIMATSAEGNRMARKITGEMTRFVNENIHRAASKGHTRTPDSVKRWHRKQQLTARKQGKAKVA